MRIKNSPKKRCEMSYGDYVKLAGDDLTWAKIQSEHDRVYDRAVQFLRSQGYERYVSNIQMVIKIETKKTAMLGDLLRGDAPFITIGWKCEVDAE